MTNDRTILRDLARQYAEVATHPKYDARRDLWRRHLSLHPGPVPVLVSYGMWNVWCREVFGDTVLQCADPFCRGHEQVLRLALFHDTIGDDWVAEPWLTQGAVRSRGWGTLWGVAEGQTRPGIEGGSWRFDPPIKTWDDVRKLSPPPHETDEARTRECVARLQDAVGDILTVNVDRGPLCGGFSADISTGLARLRGLEQMMLDMCEAPEQLKALIAFMRDGILANQDAAERANDYSLTSQGNQAMLYCEELEPPRANSGPRRRRDLWGFFAAQEFALVSPAMHDEFLLQYQLAIMRNFGLTAYGCCEDLTRKIDILRQVPNLRIIAVAPTADVAACAAQIGRDYVISWRPNPTDMVCAEFHEDVIRGILHHGLDACRGTCVHVHLKDIETVQGEPARLARWVQIVREVAAAVRP